MAGSKGIPERSAVNRREARTRPWEAKCLEAVRTPTPAIEVRAQAEGVEVRLGDVALVLQPEALGRLREALERASLEASWRAARGGR